MSEHPEPIAWMYETEKSCAGPFIERQVTITLDRREMHPSYRETPLYAHPVAAPDVERDAARYRWLRDQSANQYEHPIVVSQDAKRTPRYLGPLLGELLDAAVDAGVAEIPKPKTMSMYASREAMQADVSKGDTTIERPNPAGHETAED